MHRAMTGQVGHFSLLTFKNCIVSYEIFILCLKIFENSNLRLQNEFLDPCLKQTIISLLAKTSWFFMLFSFY